VSNKCHQAAEGVGTWLERADQSGSLGGYLNPPLTLEEHGVADAEGWIPNQVFHDLRRIAARNLLHAGVADWVIMKIGGWRTRSVFERYAIVTLS
jgi:hypothetical protein